MLLGQREMGTREIWRIGNRSNSTDTCSVCVIIRSYYE